jgi:hypothetical protein
LIRTVSDCLYQWLDLLPDKHDYRRRVLSLSYVHQYELCI